MDEYLNGASLVALLTLTSLEMVLGIDNVIFIAILFLCKVSSSHVRVLLVVCVV